MDISRNFKLEDLIPDENGTVNIQISLTLDEIRQAVSEHEETGSRNDILKKLYGDRIVSDNEVQMYDFKISDYFKEEPNPSTIKYADVSDYCDFQYTMAQIQYCEENITDIIEDYENSQDENLYWQEIAENSIFEILRGFEENQVGFEVKDGYLYSKII